MKLRDAQTADDDARSVAIGRHETWVAAVAGYLAMRRRKLLTGISDAASFDADKARHRITMLREVGKTLGAELGRLDPNDESVIEKPRGLSQNDHYLQLAFLLTPLGWREKHLPALEKRRAQAIEDWVESKEPDQNLALAYEIEQMIAFLQAVEQRGCDAARVTPVVGRQTETGVSLRPAM